MGLRVAMSAAWPLHAGDAAGCRAWHSRHGVWWPWSAAAPLNLFRAVDYFSRFFEKPWHELYRRRARPGHRHAAQLRADSVGAQAAGDFQRARPRRHRRRAGRSVPTAASPPTAARCSCWSHWPRCCRSWSRSWRSRRSTTASAISCSCCRRWPCSAASPPPGCTIGLRASLRAGDRRRVLVFGDRAAGRRDGAAASLRIHLLQSHRRRRARRARELHARLLGPVVQAGLAGVWRRARRTP